MVPRGHTSHLMGRHGHSAWSLTHFHPIATRWWHQVAPGYPFSRLFLWYSYLDSVLVYTLNDASVTFEWSRADYDGLADLELVVLAAVTLVETGLNVGFLGELLHSLWGLGQNRTVIGFFYCDTWGLVELLVEKEHKVFVDMLDDTSKALI